MIALRGVTKRYGLTFAVRDLSFEIRDQEFLAIYGPAGAGKTTTLRLIAGVTKPTTGDILQDRRSMLGAASEDRNAALVKEPALGLDDTTARQEEPKSILHLAPEHRDMAMAFENYALYSHMSVYDNLAFPLRAKKFSRQEIDERVQRIARILQISELLDRRPGFLSGGQRQRVALGRAIIRPAGIYLLDEPIGHLDAKLRHRMRGELKAMAADLDATVAMVTTSSREALALGDRIAILRNGILEQIGTPEEIYHAPCNEFVASFVGEPPMSFLDVEPMQLKGQTCFKLQGSEHLLPVTPRLVSTLHSDTAGYRLGWRASEVTLSGQEDERRHTPGEVYVVEPMGYCNIVTVKVGDGLVRVVVDQSTRLKPKENLWLCLDCEHAHLFYNHKAVSHPAYTQLAR